MARRKCHICGSRTETGDVCTVTYSRKSVCRPDLAVPIEREAWLCEACLYAYEVIGYIGNRYLETNDVELDP